MELIVVLEGGQRREGPVAKDIVAAQRDAEIVDLQMLLAVEGAAIEVLWRAVAEDVDAIAVVRDDTRRRAEIESIRSQRTQVAIFGRPICHRSAMHVEQQGQIFDRLPLKLGATGGVVGAVLALACQSIERVATRAVVADSD